jgi:NAD(P)-dependent dehydrogenase (short-subunit alcohol dehydrogenase family)
MSVDLTGRVALITGGTKGLGHGLAEAFRAAGADVMTCARNAPTGDAAAHPFVAADLRDPDAATSVVTATVERFGRLDVLINNAGGSPPGDAATVSPRFIEKIVALNLLAPFYVAQAAYGAMSKQPEGGSVINIGSLSGMRPSPGSAAYGAAKAGLANLTQTLAMEWAPSVRVNCVTVGYLETEQAGLFFGNDDGIAAVAAMMPMRRLVQPHDVAQACLFLASPEASFITGANLAVHGGGEVPPFLTAATHD